MKSGQEAQLIRRYIKAYLALLGVIFAFVVVSMAQGAGWRPALAGMPLYVTLFVAISYRLARELMTLRRKVRKHQIPSGGKDQ